MAIKKHSVPVASQDQNTKGALADAAAGDESGALDQMLRPGSLDEYSGQPEIKRNLRVFLHAARERGEPLDHTLLYGPPGLGKTTLALLLAKEMGAQLRLTSGPALEKPGDLAAILTNLKEHDLLFIDEIHRLRRPVEEVLYTAMEDFAIDLIVGEGPSARTMRLQVPRFTLVGATTKMSALSGPLRDRFGHTEKLRYYEEAELQQILARSAQILEVEAKEEALVLLSGCCRRTPRIANRLLRRMRDFAQVLHAGTITREVVEQGLESLSVDRRGLDFADRQYMTALCETFHGGPVGLSTLSAAIGEETATIEDVIEPFLIREGLVMKTLRGRQSTQEGFTHMGVVPPASNSHSLFSENV